MPSHVSSHRKGMGRKSSSSLPESVFRASRTMGDRAIARAAKVTSRPTLEEQTAGMPICQTKSTTTQHSKRSQHAQ